MKKKVVAPKALPSPAADAAGGGNPPSLVDDARRLAVSLAEVPPIPKGAKFSADYLLELEQKRLGLQQAAAEFLAGLEKYQWIIDAVLAQKAERARLRPIDPEQLTNPVERSLAFANMARMTNQVMRAMAKENQELIKIAMEGVKES